MRLMIRPSIWGPQMRLRLSNALGTKPVTFDGVHVGLQRSGSVIQPGSNQAVMFDGKPSVTVAPGQSVWSDPVKLPFVHAEPDPALHGRRLAVSLHVVGESGPMTWHAKALTTSYLTPPGAGAKGESDGVLDFPFSTASWYFLDAVEMAAPADARVIVAFGDSITDGTASTLNGDDRWEDVLLQRLHAAGATNVAVVNAGIGGNQVAGPASYAPDKPFAGGPSALDRLDRDVLSLSGVTAVIWLEGINDFSKNGNRSAEAVIEGMKQGVARNPRPLPRRESDRRYRHVSTGQQQRGPWLPGAGRQAQGFERLHPQRRPVRWVADFDKATLDSGTGGMRPEFIPESTTGGPGDKLHPNRAGYQAMGAAIDLAPLLAGLPAAK